MTIQNWKKIGLFLRPNKRNKWNISHCMVPTALKLSKNSYRIFYATRNKKNQSVITYADIKIEKNIKVINKSKNISLNTGKLGAFDDNGVLPSCVIKHKNKYLMYYIGWQPRVTTSYSLVAGLSVSTDGKNFKRFSQSQILHTNSQEPFSILTAPFVIKLKKYFFMWYVSCVQWNSSDYPRYNIKTAKSLDGYKWTQSGKSCLNLKKNERALARPYVLYESGKFRMWYSYEKKIGSYKIGYAESQDGFNWKRLDKKININYTSKYEKKMREYPCIIKNKKNYFMLYNGDNYGKQGVLLAKLEK
jgi:predicted GH43/DUF377 family glycosyl hydrolase